jgi:hypothetical protein
MILRSVDKRLFFSGIAAGILHIAAACTAFYIAVQGLQKSQDIIQIYIASGSSNAVSESLANRQPHGEVPAVKHVTSTPPLYEAKEKVVPVADAVREFADRKSVV